MPPLPQELSSPPTQRGTDPEAAATDAPPRRTTPHTGPPPATTARPATNGSTPKTNGKTPRTTTNGTPKPATPAIPEPATTPTKPPFISTPLPADPPSQERSSELAPASRQVVSVAPVLFGAGLGVLVVLLGLPTMVLVWRSALASPLSPSGLVGGLLVLVGLVLLSVGGFTLVSGAARVEQDATAGRWAAILLRPAVLMVLLGTVLLVCAALAVS